jgi:hypothetical protein
MVSDAPKVDGPVQIAEKLHQQTSEITSTLVELIQQEQR